jgi:formylglycine-generating enzyme required for sulfatase activity
MGHDVFISHSAKDKAAADAVCAALEAGGLNCWVAPRDIKPGESWAGAILRGIAECRMMVLVFSSHTNHSPQIRREVERAVHRDIPIAPLRIEDVMPEKDMEYFLSSSHWMDALTEPVEDHLPEFTHKVRALLEAGSDPAASAPKARPAATRPPKRASSKGRGRIIAVLITLLLAGGAAVGRALLDELARRFTTAATTPAAPGRGISPAPRATTWKAPAPGEDQAPTAGPTRPPPAPEMHGPPPAISVASPAPAPTSGPAKTPVQLALAEQQQGLAALQTLFLAGQLTASQYELGQSLLKPARAAQDEYDTARRAQFELLAQGKLAPQKLAAALSAIETPPQKGARLAAEEGRRKEAVRQKQISDLLVSARQQKTAEQQLALAERVLDLDAGNAEAGKLKAADEEVIAAAASRRARLNTLMQQARATPMEEAQNGLAILAEALRLDPGNAEAMKLKQQFDDYAARHFTNTLGMKFVRIEPGTFTMGSPEGEEGHQTDETQHKVTLTRGFMLATTPVTQAQWRAVMGTTVAEQHDKGNPQFKLAGEGDAIPMYFVSWDEAVEFCAKLSKTEGRHYRLPTEAQWEFACRAGTKGAYGGTGKLDDMGWFADNSGDQVIDSADIWKTDKTNYAKRVVDDNHCHAHAVAGKQPNAWGLYDMHGNVWQWCADVYDEKYYENGAATDPSGPELNPNSWRVLRGGSWGDRPASCRSACRGRIAPGYRNVSFGFRVALDSP